MENKSLIPVEFQSIAQKSKLISEQEGAHRTNIQIANSQRKVPTALTGL